MQAAVLESTIQASKQALMQESVLESLVVPPLLGFPPACLEGEESQQVSGQRPFVSASVDPYRHGCGVGRSILSSVWVRHVFLCIGHFNLISKCSGDVLWHHLTAERTATTT